MLARARQVASLPRHPCKQRCHNHCCAPLIPLSLHLVLTVSCQLVFSSKRSLSRHPRLLLPPNPLRSRYAPYYFIGVNRRLLLGSPAGREGVVLSQFLLCYVSFLLLPPSFHRCGSIRFFRASFRSAATYFQPKGELVFHSLHYVPPIPLRSIKLHYIHSFRQALLRPRKRNYTPRKNSASTPEAATVLIALRYTPHSLSATLAPLATASPLTTAAGIALHFVPQLCHCLRSAQGCFPCSVFRCFCPEPKICL